MAPVLDGSAGGIGSPAAGNGSSGSLNLSCLLPSYTLFSSSPMQHDNPYAPPLPPPPPPPPAVAARGKRKRLTKVCYAVTVLVGRVQTPFQACESCHKSKRRCDGACVYRIFIVILHPPADLFLARPLSELASLALSGRSAHPILTWHTQ